PPPAGGRAGRRRRPVPHPRRGDLERRRRRAGRRGRSPRRARGAAHPAGDAVSAPPAAACPARAGERGFTLIELMIALVVSSLLVGFLFSMTRQIGDAFRAQRRVTDVQQTLRTVGALMASDLRQAGFLVSAGFRTSAWGTPDLIVQPLQIVNDADGTGPDLIRIYYADPSASGR